MTENIIVALIALAAAILGSFTGGIASSSLTRYRIKELEKKVDKHNSVVERMTIAEEKIKIVNSRIYDIEEFERMF